MSLDTKKALEDSPNSAEKIHKLAREARIAELLKETGETEGVKMMLADMENHVNECNVRLAADCKQVADANGRNARMVRLTEKERDVLFLERAIYSSLIELFPNASTRLENLTKKLKQYEH